MPISLTLACLWAVMGCAVGIGPERFHWPAAWALIAVGIPLVGFVTFQMGPWWGLAILVSGASILRWPIIRGFQAMQRAVTTSTGREPPK